MFARSAKFQAKPDQLHKIKDEIPGLRDAINEISGCVDCYFAWKNDGRGITFVVYDTQANADAAIPQVQAIWAGMAELLLEPPTLENYESVEILSR